MCVCVTVTFLHVPHVFGAVYKQRSGEITPTQPKLGLTGKGRNNTKVRDIVAEYKLEAPVAGNFFQAQWDDYVPKLYEKLS